jgi:hypothetical protein
MHNLALADGTYKPSDYTPLRVFGFGILTNRQGMFKPGFDISQVDKNLEEWLIKLDNRAVPIPPGFEKWDIAEIGDLRARFIAANR